MKNTPVITPRKFLHAHFLSTPPSVPQATTVLVSIILDQCCWFSACKR